MPTLHPWFITFDCYRTLTWSRISDMAKELFAIHLRSDHIDQFVADFTTYRFAKVLGTWQPSVNVIKSTLERTCRRHHIAFIEAEEQRIYEAIPTWGPHRNVLAQLRRIADHSPLVIHDQIQHNADNLGTPFHAAFTADQAQSYEPRTHDFKFMLDSVGSGLQDVLQVSASLRYDLMTARPRYPRQCVHQPQLRTLRSLRRLSRDARPERPVRPRRPLTQGRNG